MIAFVQPFGLHSPGGGARILRALLKHAPCPFFSVSTSPMVPPPTSCGSEVHLPVRPPLGSLEFKRLGRGIGKVMDVYPPFARQFEKHLSMLLDARGATAVHAIPHGLDFWYAYRVAENLGLPYCLNVHDDMTYNLQGMLYVDEAMERLAYVWPRATSCIVISEAMGEEYCRRYGKRSFQIVTDGLESIPQAPLRRTEDSLRVYIMGATHLSYEPNFRALIQALEQIQRDNPGREVSFTIRGGLPFAMDQINNIPIRVLPWGTEEDVRNDLDRVDLLYLPLPFDPQYEAFSRYSLSTKMVTYLGSGLPILYHGPSWAAAGRLLTRQEAGVIADTLDVREIVDTLNESMTRRTEIIENALALGRKQFLLSDQRRRFQEILYGMVNPVAYSEVLTPA